MNLVTNDNVGLYNTTTSSSTFEYPYRFSEICAEVSDISIGTNGRVCYEAAG